MVIKFEYPEGATPLDEDSKQALIPPLVTQSELNEFEQHNIGLATLWANESQKLKKSLLSVVGLKTLHEKMFDQTWLWAGKFRIVDTNIGVDWHTIQEEVYKLCEDVKYWIEHQTFSWSEITVRFHHRLVSIHPFPNGNGRHSRLAANLLLQYNSQTIFSWGGKVNLQTASNHRKEYILALQDADRGDLERLLRFALSK